MTGLLAIAVCCSLSAPPADAGGVIEGVVVNGSRGQAPVEGAEIVLRADQNGVLVPIAKTTSDDEGRFRFEGIPPGDYRLFCWEDVQIDDWRNPAFLTAVQDRGKTVRVDAGSRLTADALMIPIRD